MDSPSEKYKKRIKDQENTIEYLEKELQATSDNLQKLSAGIILTKTSFRNEDEDVQQLKLYNDCYKSQIQILELKIFNQNKKFENYRKTVGCLEKQLQTTLAKCSELEGEVANCQQRSKTFENENISLKTLLKTFETRITELEKLKVTQAMIINEQSLKNKNSMNEPGLKQDFIILNHKFKELNQENAVLKSINRSLTDKIISIANDHKALETQSENKDSKEVHHELQETLFFDLSINENPLTKTLPINKNSEKNFKNEKNQLIENEIFYYISKELKESDHFLIKKKLSDIFLIYHKLQSNFKEFTKEKIVSILEFLTKLENFFEGSDLNEIFLKIQNSHNFSKSGVNSLEKIIKEKICYNIKLFFEKNISIIVSIHDLFFALNNRLMKITDTLYNLPLVDSKRAGIDEIKKNCKKTENFESEDDSSAFQDYYKNLALEIHNLKSKVDEKDKLVSKLLNEIEHKTLEIEKLTTEKIELLNKQEFSKQELKKLQEIHDLATKTSTNTIFCLEEKLQTLESDYEAYKSSINNEKDQLFDHMIMAEKESDIQLSK